MKTVFNLISLALLSGILSACGGGGSSPAAALISPSNDSPAANSTTTAAVVNQSFAFAPGVAAFGTTGATTVAFTSTSASPSFSISSAQGAATGVTTFGSCIFTVTSSTFPAGSPLANGQVVRVDPCALNIATSGAAANGSSTPRNVNLVLGALVSTAIAVPVVVNVDGSVAINGVTVDKVAVSPVTGS